MLFLLVILQLNVCGLATGILGEPKLPNKLVNTVFL